MAFVNIKNTPIDLIRAIDEFNQTYYLTNTFTQEPFYKNSKWKSIEVKLTYNETNINRFISSLYYLFFEEKIDNFFRLSLSDIELSQSQANNQTLTATFNLYFNKKNIKLMNETSQEFTNYMNTNLNRILETNFQQYIITTSLNKTFDKYNIESTFALLEGRLNTYLIPSDNTIDYILNLVKPTDYSETFYNKYYTIQTDRLAYLILYLESNDTIINLMNNIFSNTFYNSKYILYYEPLFRFTNDDYSELLDFYYLLDYNNINVNLIFININNNCIVLIDKIYIKDLLRREKISQIFEISNKKTFIDYTPLFLEFPKNITEYHQELFDFFIKNNKSLIQKLFYYSKDYSKLSNFKIHSYDNFGNFYIEKLYYIPFISLGKFTKELELEWSSITSLWNDFLVEWITLRELKFIRKIEIPIIKDYSIEQYIIISNILENEGIHFDYIETNNDKYIINDVSINDYNKFVEKTIILKNKIKEDLDLFINDKIQLIKISSIPELKKILGKIMQISPIYNWILKKKLRDENNKIINYIHYKNDIYFIVKNLPIPIIQNIFSKLITPFIYRTLPAPNCSNIEDKIIHKKINDMTDIEILTLSNFNNKCYSLESILSELENSKINNSSVRVEKYLLTKKDLQQIYKLLLDNIEEHFIEQFISTIKLLNISNYKLDIIDLKDNLLEVNLLETSTNTKYNLINIPKNINLVKLIFSLWSNKKLLPIISYRLNSELGYIPKKLIKLRNNLEIDKYTSLDEKERLKYLLEYFNSFN